MSVNSERSMNADLHAGMSDGSYQKEYVNWGGTPVASNVKVTLAQRHAAFDAHMTNSPSKGRPVGGDGTAC